jgi:hypothetical protein
MNARRRSPGAAAPAKPPQFAAQAARQQPAELPAQAQAARGKGLRRPNSDTPRAYRPIAREAAPADGDPHALS